MDIIADKILYFICMHNIYSIRYGIKNQLEKIISPDEYSLIMKPTNKKGITATYFNVTLNTPQLHIRTLSDIQTIFTNSGLSQDIQHTSMEIFHNLAEAEAKRLELESNAAQSLCSVNLD